MRWVFTCLIVLPLLGTAQTEDEFLPEVRTLVMDSTERSVQRFCNDIMSKVQGYKIAFVDREDVMMSKYVYDDKSYESVKMEYQFGVKDVDITDSTGAVIATKKSRVVILIRITAELSVMADIYSYLFNATYTPDKIMAISRYDKPVSYNGQTYNTTVVSDNFKAGYWTLSFYKL